MAFEQQKPIVSRLRAAMKSLRLALEEAQAAVNQYNALGGSAFAAYYASAEWAADNGDISSAAFPDAVSTLSAFYTLWDTSDAPSVGPHKTNIAKSGKP